MSRFPYDDCPSAWDLSLFSRGLFAREDDALATTVEDHVGECSECQAAIAALRNWQPSLDSSAHVDMRDREHLSQDGAQSGTENAAIAAGQLWTCDVAPVASEYFFYGAAPALMAIVQSPGEDGGDRIMVAPTTDDEELAAEWSLVIGDPHSGLYHPVVVHLDRQFPIRRQRLNQLVSGMSGEAVIDLKRSASAFWASVGLRAAEAISSDTRLAVGILGDFSIRDRPDWIEQSNHIQYVVNELGLVDAMMELETALEPAAKAATRPEWQRSEVQMAFEFAGETFELIPLTTEPETFIFTQAFTIRKLLAVWTQQQSAVTDAAVVMVRQTGDVLKTVLSSFTRLEQPLVRIQFQGSTREAPPSSARRTVLRATVADGTVCEILTDDAQRIFFRIVDQ